LIKSFRAQSQHGEEPIELDRSNSKSKADAKANGRCQNKTDALPKPPAT